MNKILVIGCGHMGSALVSAWNSKAIYNISVVDPNNYKKIRTKYKNKIKAYKLLSELKNSINLDVVIFAIKPQAAHNVLMEIKNLNFKRTCLFISIIAGKRIDFFNKYLPSKNQFIRVMPNMPAAIELGMTCLLENKFTSIVNKKKASALFLAVGKILWLKNESEINIVTAISGSGPGYVFLFIDAFEKAALRFGLSQKETKKLVHQTMLGSINLLLKEKKTSITLANNIAVSGGTTEAALKILKKNNQLHLMFEKALEAAYKRAKYLGK